MAEVSKESQLIPVNNLLDWYNERNERIDEINARRKKLDTVQRAGEPSVIDIEFTALNL